MLPPEQGHHQSLTTGFVPALLTCRCVTQICQQRAIRTHAPGAVIDTAACSPAFRARARRRAPRMTPVVRCAVGIQCSASSESNVFLSRNKFIRKRIFSSVLFDLALDVSLSPYELLRKNFTLICRYKARYPLPLLFLVFHAKAKNFIFLNNAFPNYFQHSPLSFIP